MVGIKERLKSSRGKTRRRLTRRVKKINLNKDKGKDTLFQIINLMNNNISNVQLSLHSQTSNLSLYIQIIKFNF